MLRNRSASGGTVRSARWIRRMNAAALVCCAGAVTTATALGPPPTFTAGVELLAADALIMAGTDMPVVDQAWIDMAVGSYIRPTLGGDYTGVPVDTPAQFWPFTGPEDMLFDTSVQGGTAAIRAAIDAETAQSGHSSPTVVFGYSQSAVIATAAKRRLAESVSTETDAPAVSFVMLANLDRPNGGINSRFAGAFIEELGWTFAPAAPTDTPFTTVDVARQYDLFADFPRYPLNVFALANAVVALFYGAHDYSEVTLDPTDPRYDPDTVIQQWGDTTYYFIPTDTLPLLRPLRDLGADPVLLDAAEPALRVLVESGYDRTTPFGQPAPAVETTPLADADRLNRELADAIEQGRSILEAAAPPAAEPSTAAAAPLSQREVAESDRAEPVRTPRRAGEAPRTGPRPGPSAASRSRP